MYLLRVLGLGLRVLRVVFQVWGLAFRVGVRSRFVLSQLQYKKGADVCTIGSHHNPHKYGAAVEELESSCYSQETLLSPK